jgi:hypothetical protein
MKKLLFVLAALCLQVQLKADSLYGPLVSGVSNIFDSGAPGWVLPQDASWVHIVAGAKTATAPSDFVIVRSYGAGRVMVIGHEAIFSDTSSDMFDNTQFLVNTLNWLGQDRSRTPKNYCVHPCCSCYLWWHLSDGRHRLKWTLWRLAHRSRLLVRLHRGSCGIRHSRFD